MALHIDSVEILKKYAGKGTKVFEILKAHSGAVKNLSLLIASKNPHLHADIELLEVAAMLHDIGIVKTKAPGIGCFGKHPYVCHGFLGREILEAEGLSHIAPFCERHTGT
ncbi:MAG: HDIG domain-containing protein, partial [Bacteroidales bacterium]|nr:HDIG domain-containing protein [Bacteroidales bacterium]